MSYYPLLTAVLTGYAAARAFLTRRGRAGRSPVHAG